MIDSVATLGPVKGQRVAGLTGLLLEVIKKLSEFLRGKNIRAIGLRSRRGEGARGLSRIHPPRTR